MLKTISTNKTQPVTIERAKGKTKILSSNKIESKFFPPDLNIIVPSGTPYIDTHNIEKFQTKKKKRKYQKKETMPGEKKKG